MLGKHSSTITVVILVAIVIGYLYERYKPKHKLIIEKPVYIDISKVDDLQAFVLNESEYDKAVSQAKKLREAFLEERYGEIESFLASINTKSTSWDLSSLIRFYLRRLKEHSASVDFDVDLSSANRWLAKSPNSEFAYTFRAHIYHIKGWDARGNKFSNKTPRENFVKMEKYLQLAIADYQQALTINQKNDYAWASLIALSKASSKLGLDYNGLLESAEKHLPNSYYIKQRYLDRSQPKWGGSFEKIFRFARAQNVKDFPELAMLVARAHEHKADYYAKNKGSHIDDTALSLNWLDLIRLVVQTIFELIFDGNNLQNNLFGISNKSGGYWERYGEYFENQEVWAEYSTAYKTVFSVNANVTQGLFEYARSARHANRLEIADEYYDRAVSSGVYFLDEEKIYYIGRFHQTSSKNLNKANKYYRLYLEIDSNYTDVEKAAFAADYVHWHYSNNAAYKEGFPFSQIAYDLKPNDKRLIANHCNAFFNVHRYADGIPYCMESLKIDPDYSWPHFMLSQIYQRLGDSEKSAYYRERYKELSE